MTLDGLVLDVADNPANDEEFDRSGNDANARHNSYRVKKPGDSTTRHDGPTTIRLHSITSRAA